MRPHQGKLVIPHCEGTQRVLVASAALHRLEQRITLPQNPLVLTAVPRHHGAQGDGQLIHKSTTTGGIALHQLQVLGGKQHRASNTQSFLSAHRGSPVNAHAIRLTGSHLKLGHGLLRTAHSAGADVGSGGTHAHQRTVVAHPVRRESGRVLNGFHDICFSHAIRAQKNRHPGR